MSVKIKIRNKTGTDVWFRVYYPGDLPGLYDLQESIVPASYTQVFIKLPKGGVKMEWMPNWEDAEPGDDDDFKPFQTMEFERPMKKQTTFLFSFKKKKAVRGAEALKKKENAKRWQERKKAKNEEKSRIFSPASHAQVEESKSSRDAIRKMAGGGRLRRKSRPSKKTGTTTTRKQKKKKTTASSPNIETKHAAALSLLEQRIARQAAEAEKHAKRTEEAKAIGLAAAKRRKREEEKEEEKISFPVDANASTSDQGEDSPVVLPEWVKQKCLQMGDSSLSMASRFLAEGKSSSSGTSVSSSVRAAARRSLGRRSSNGTTPPDVSPATLDELVGARRATIRPAIAAAAHRGSRHRAIARQEMSEATSVSPSASESPRLLESMSGSSDDVLSQGFTAGVPRRAVAAAAAFSSAADGAIASRRATGHANVDSNVTRLSPLKRASFRANSPLKLPKATSRAQRDRMYSVAPASARSLLKALFSEVSGGEKKNAQKESEKDDSSIVIADVKAAEAKRREALVAAAKEARALIESKGLRLWKDASNYDRKKGKLLHVGSVKAAASLKKYPGIICLFKREGAHAYSVKALTEEVEMQRKIASFGVRTALALTDPFEFKVDGTKTFGYLAEQIYTTMGEPYKPQAHKTTWCAMGACLRQLSNEQLDRATMSAQVIGVFNKFNHFLHDMQLLLQNCSPCDDQNGFIYVIDPGSLMPPRKSGGNQTYRLQRFLRKIRKERKGS